LSPIHAYARFFPASLPPPVPFICIEAAFQFLLDREPKESILRRSDVTVISYYFPEFERELPHYL